MYAKIILEHSFSHFLLCSIFSIVIGMWSFVSFLQCSSSLRAVVIMSWPICHVCWLLKLITWSSGLMWPSRPFRLILIRSYIMWYIIGRNISCRSMIFCDILLILNERTYTAYIFVYYYNGKYFDVCALVVRGHFWKLTNHIRMTKTVWMFTVNLNTISITTTIATYFQLLHSTNTHMHCGLK